MKCARSGTMARLARAASGRSLCRLLAGVVLLLPVMASLARAQEPVIRVEEDWVLILNEPNDNLDSPQFHTTMSPFPNLDSYFAVVSWNYRETPDFVPGGVQLQSWNGDERIRSRTIDYGQLSTSAETITWTQSLETDGAVLLFQVLNGQSTTWGTFGRDMRIDADANLPDLSGYSPDASVGNSCISYGANRVDVLMITQVRRYGPSGLLSVDSKTRVVYMRPAH
ncbi:MAG TPA: hypothetical protein PLC79_00675 [Phycisphaerae bacterium]|nr:hypothetical protein [Phycisphaerae bacterium]